MAMFMNEQTFETWGGAAHYSFISAAFGNALRAASAQVTQALNNALEAELVYHDEHHPTYEWREVLRIIVSIRIYTPNPNFYNVSIHVDNPEDIETIKTVLQGFMPAAGADTNAAPEAPAGAARRRKSRKSRKSKKVSRRRRVTRRY
jgi:hypothetical protein